MEELMCRRVDCKKCGKPTFAGCGMHVEQVLGDVPASRRCRCHEAADQPSTESSQASGGGWLKSLFGGS
jgi:hypothetical protein